MIARCKLPEGHIDMAAEDEAHVARIAAEIAQRQQGDPNAMVEQAAQVMRKLGVGSTDAPDEAAGVFGRMVAATGPYEYRTPAGATAYLMPEGIKEVLAVEPVE